ncbi:Dynein light chain LC6, flagellar outer arm [Linum perenne]
MLEGKAVVAETDMLQTMQDDAVHLAAKALDFFDEFDRVYGGGGWMCIVGTDFGSFVTHCSGCFIHFHIGSLAILLFRGSATPQLQPTTDVFIIPTMKNITSTYPHLVSPCVNVYSVTITRFLSARCRFGCM